MKYVQLTRSGKDYLTGLRTVIENSENPASRLDVGSYRDYQLLDNLDIAREWSSGTPHYVSTSEFFDDILDSTDFEDISSDDKSKLVTSLIRKGYLEIRG